MNATTTKKLPLCELNPKMLKRNKVYAFIGRRGAGKSHLMEMIVYFLRRIPNCVVFSESEEGNEAWGKHVPRTFIHALYSTEKMQKIYERQKQEKRKVKQNPKYKPEQVLVVLEDQTFDDKLSRDTMIKKVLFNGRHYGITMCITMQYTKALSPALREQIDYIFCLQQKNAMVRKKMHEDWFGIFPDFKVFESTLMQCTNDYGALVMDQTAKSWDIQENVFYYRAPAVIPRYYVGNAKYWFYHYMSYKGEDAAAEDADDTREILQITRKLPKLEVVKKPPRSVSQQKKMFR